MTTPSSKSSNILVNRHLGFRAAVFFLIALFLGNLNAMVDHFLHPGIPYFDHEHVIVGGVTFGVSILLFFFLILYEIRLNRALSRTLEAFLPICAYCKKVRMPDAPTEDPESWQKMEYYISERVETQFSHGVCPDCLEANLADLDRPIP